MIQIYKFSFFIVDINNHEDLQNYATLCKEAEWPLDLL